MNFLAFRYLLSRRRQTLLMLLGVSFGTAAFVLLSGIMLGFRGYLVGQLLDNSGHVYIQAREEFLTERSLDASFFSDAPGLLALWRVPPSGRKDSDTVEFPQAWYARLAADPRVAAYSPRLTTAVLFAKGRATATSTLIGCDPDRQARVTTIGRYVTEGRFGDLGAGGRRLALGDELKRKLGVELSQNVLVSLPDAAAPVPFKIAAVFRTGNKLFDETAYTSLVDVQALNRTPNRVNEIIVRLKDHRGAAAAAAGWARLGPEKVESWDRRNAYIFDVFRIQDTVRFSSIGAVLIVAGFGIYNVLNMMALQKRRDVAILRSIGYTTRDITVLFFSQGIALGVAGSLFGLLIGYAVSLPLESIQLATGPMGGVGHLMIERSLVIYCQAATMALTSAVLASVLPARAAARTPPIEIIRGGGE